MSAPGRSGFGALLQLAVAVVAGRLTRPRRFDPGRTVCRWAQSRLVRGGEESIAIRIGRRDFLVMGPGEGSREILDGSPAAHGLRPGELKREAMGFLAPRALTIAHGEDWARLRALHDQVLAFQGDHALAQTFLECVRDAFHAPVRSTREVREAMGRAMQGIVLGERSGRNPELPADVHALFGAVQSPLRRKLLGWRYRKRRETLYATLAARWAGATADDPSLLGLASRFMPPSPSLREREELLEQIPHWMFTFTGSGTDLFRRTLSMITSRPAVHVRVREELADTGSLDRAEAIRGLRFVPACLLETGRLFPPVTRTLHRGDPREGFGTFDTEIVHYFPLLHRDEALGSSVHDFRPDRWLGSAPDPPALASLLFLRGPRACPGRELILFVCCVALARQLGDLELRVRRTCLSHDPLPVTFPESEARFQAERTS